jgi:hypothetical protein
VTCWRAAGDPSPIPVTVGERGEIVLPDGSGVGAAAAISDTSLCGIAEKEDAVDPEDVFELAEAVVEGDTEEIVEETLEILFDVDL